MLNLNLNLIPSPFLLQSMSPSSSSSMVLPSSSMVLPSSLMVMVSASKLMALQSSSLRAPPSSLKVLPSSSSLKELPSGSWSSSLNESVNQLDPQSVHQSSW